MEALVLRHEYVSLFSDESFVRTGWNNLDILLLETDVKRGSQLNKMECKSCGKSIVADSCFCKYCGASVGTYNVNANNERKLASIFQSVYRTLQTYSDYSEKEFEEKFEAFKSYENRVMSDNDYYEVLVDIIFYSGFRASTVEKYLERIHTHFPDYHVVSNYSLDEIVKIKNDPNMIQNKSKIDACVQNAKRVTEIVDKYGSIKAYIDSFDHNSSDEALHRLKKSLESSFSFLGGVTSYHFMTDI